MSRVGHIQVMKSDKQEKTVIIVNRNSAKGQWITRRYEIPSGASAGRIDLVLSYCENIRFSSVSIYSNALIVHYDIKS